jgi:nicotinate-nucleotide adenylyltransferase
MQVAFYGGSFNPPHVGHVLAAAYLLSVRFDRVLVVPVYQHAFDKPLADFEDRLQMCELAMGWLPGVEVSGVEASLGVPSRTLRTLEYLTARHPDWIFRLVVGADQLIESEKWHGFERIVSLAPLFVLGRAGVEHPGVPRPVLPQVSSSQIRKLLAHRGDEDAEAELGRLMPRGVLGFVEQHGLYR